MVSVVVRDLVIVMVWEVFVVEVVVFRYLILIIWKRRLSFRCKISPLVSRILISVWRIRI